MKNYSELVAAQVEKAIWANEGPMMDGDTLSCTIDGVTLSGEVAVSPILISVKLRMPELELYNTDAISFRSPDIFTTERSSKAPCSSLGFRRLKMLLIEAYEDIISSCRISPYTIKTAILELMEACYNRPLNAKCN